MCRPDDPRCNDTGGGSYGVDQRKLKEAMKGVQKKLCGGGTKGKTTGDENCGEGEVSTQQAIARICNKRSEVDGKCEVWAPAPKRSVIDYNSAQPDNVVTDDGTRPPKGRN